MVGHLDLRSKNGRRQASHANSDEDLGEGDRHKAVERAPALLNSRPQQGALIGVEKKGG
jgi:hypothetical protein